MEGFNIRYKENGKIFRVKSNLRDSEVNMRKLDDKEGVTDVALYCGDNLMDYYTPGSECLSGPCPHY